MSPAETLASFAQACRAQLINGSVNAKAIHFTVSVKTDVKQIMCLTGECQTLQPGLRPLESTVAPWCLNVQSFWMKVTSALVLSLNYRRALPRI